MTVQWRKSSRSGVQQGECVELAHLGGDIRGIRDSKHTTGRHLAISREALRRLVEQVKSGDHGI